MGIKRCDCPSVFRNILPYSIFPGGVTPPGGFSFDCKNRFRTTPQIGNNLKPRCPGAKNGNKIISAPNAEINQHSYHSIDGVAICGTVPGCQIPDLHKRPASSHIPFQFSDSLQAKINAWSLGVPRSSPLGCNFSFLTRIDSTFQAYLSPPPKDGVDYAKAGIR